MANCMGRCDRYRALFHRHRYQKPSVSDIWEYIREGCDGIPPLYSAMAHFLIPVFGNEALAARLPATLGFGAMVLGVFAFCKARMNAAYSLLAALLCCQVCLYFAREGRPYGAVLGCATWALVFWQRAPTGRRADWIGLGVCLSLAVSLHYYAICLLGPLLLAEMIMAWRDRKWNPGVLWAMAAPVMVLAIHYPLIDAGRRFQVHFWSKAEFAMILPFYERFLGPILLLCGGAFAVFRVFTLLNGGARESVRTLSLRELIMLLALCATPALTVMVSMVTTHMFVARYVLWAAPGFAIVAAAMLERSLAPNKLCLGL